MCKQVGYSFWGFLADVKMNENGERISTPDGNAFYSWSIFLELQRRGYSVVSVMPDRDKPAVDRLGSDAFKSWATIPRLDAYLKSSHIGYKSDYKCLTKSQVFELWNNQKLYECEFILHEWRMQVVGRNTVLNVWDRPEGWQPDLFIQQCLIEYCTIYKIPLVIFDLDYKLTKSQFGAILKETRYTSVIELGNKWQTTCFKDRATTVYIPFAFDYINRFGVIFVPTDSLVYIGNRYERDWCIDKYIPESMMGCTVFGNWTESGRDSKQRWPLINFGPRLQTEELLNAYSNSLCTVLLAKRDYCRYSFMTARLVEAVFYGTVPLFIEEYGKDTIKNFAGEYADMLTVTSKEDVINKVEYFRNNLGERVEVITYLRKYLRKMDASVFVSEIEKIVEAM